MRRGTCDPSFGADFKFSAHKDQLVVGSVFVKIYNEQPDFPLEVRVTFILDEKRYCAHRVVGSNCDDITGL